MKQRKRKPSSSARGRRGGAAARRSAGSAAGGGTGEQRRALIAQQAARLVLDHGISDYGFAKRKAADRLGVVSEALLPSNREVEQAVLDHQRLFGGERAFERLADMRRGALEAMRFFRRFEVRATGPLVSGAVSDHTDITLHLFADASEEVARVLLDAAIPYQQQDERLRFSNHRWLTCPTFTFHVEGNDYRVVVMPEDAIREAPLSPVTGRPERRVGRAELEQLLRQAGDGEADAPGPGGGAAPPG